MDGTCYFCGDSLDAAGSHDCMRTCTFCGHIGHEHSSDGTCRGTNYDMPWPDNKPVVEPCEPHEFTLKTPVVWVVPDGAPLPLEYDPMIDRICSIP
jgi:hypothetical protein